MPVGTLVKKLKNVLIEEDERLPNDSKIPLVSMEEDEEAIQELLKPRSKKIVKIAIKDKNEIRLAIPYVQSSDIVLVDLRLVKKNPEELQKIIHKLEGIATASNSKIFRLAGCDNYVIIVPSDVEVYKQ